MALEEIKKRAGKNHNMQVNEDINWLIAEVEWLTKMLIDSDKSAHDKSNVAYWSKAAYEEIDKREKAEAEVRRLQGDTRWLERMIEVDAVIYQRRHRRWALEKAKLNLEDLRWVQESQSWQDRGRAEKAEAEVERLRGLQDKWGEEFARADRHRFVAEQRAEKAEAELQNLTPGGSEFQLVEECVRWIRDRLSTRAKQAIENRRLTERVRELAEIALNWIVSAQQARGSIFGPRDEVDYESAKQRVFALQHKEGQ